MKIVVVGDGKVGHMLVQQLSQENHDVVVIDNNANALKKATDQYDVMGVLGNGATYSVQLEAGVDKADMLIAATSLDERNILCCIVAKKLGVKYTVARVRNPEYSEQMRYIENELSLAMHINPELAAAEEISRVLRYPAATKISPFARDRVEMAEFILTGDSPLNGMALYEFKNRYQLKILVCAVQRGNDVIIPAGDFVLQAHDRITIVSSAKDINTFFEKVIRAKYKVKNVMIVGGSRIAYYLTRQLLDMGIRVKIIDKEESRCRELCELLPNVRTIHGDARSKELLQEEGIENTDAFVTLTGFDEENIILSMYAMACKVPKVISKVNDFNLPDIMDKIGLDIIISPKMIVSDQIVGYVRAMQNSEGNPMETLYKLLDGKLEALGFQVRGDYPFLGVPLKDLKLRPQTLVACVVRHGRTIIADGGTTIEKNDHVVIVTLSEKIKDIRDIMV